MSTVLELIVKIPEGFSYGAYMGTKYSITKDVFNDGKSYKIFAKDLDGKDFISLNYYITNSNEILKPCEMPEQKVIDFLEQVVIGE